MRRTYILLLVSLLFFTNTLLGQTGSSQPDPGTPPNSGILRMTVEFGGQFRMTTDGDRWTKFEQYRAIPQNFTLTKLDFAVEKEGSPWSLTGWAQDATQLDQRYRLVLEKYGRMRTEFRYDGYPNFISRLVVAPYAQRTDGLLTVPDTIRGALQGAASAAVPGLVNDLLNNTEFGDLRLRRQRWFLRQEFMLNNSWEAFFQFQHDHKAGRKPIGLGTYERASTP